LVGVIDKLNFIENGYDGYEIKSGQKILFQISGTSETYKTSSASDTYNELIEDVIKVGTDMNTFSNELFSESIRLIPKTNGNGDFYNGNYTFDVYSSKINTPEKVRNFMVFENQILSLPTEIIFITPLIYEITPTHEQTDDWVKWVTYINNILRSLETEYKQAKMGYNLQFGIFSKQTSRLTSRYKPYEVEKERAFDYVKLKTEDNPQAIEKKLSELHSAVNVGSDITFNGKKTFN
jgi:hypothetical protein